MSLGSYSLGSVSLGGSHVPSSTPTPTPTPPRGTRPPLSWFPKRKLNYDGTLKARPCFANASAGSVRFDAGSVVFAREVETEAQAHRIEMRAGSEFSPRYNAPGSIEVAPVKFKGVKNLSEQEMIVLIAAMENT